MKIDPRVKEKALRIMLRALPILPGPELYDLLREVKKSQSDIDSQVQDALESIRSTSQLVRRLEESLEERAARLDELRKEHEQYSNLAQIEAKKAEVLITQIETALGRNVSRERWIAFGINIVAGLILFVLGVVVSEPLKHLLTTLHLMPQ